MRKKTKPKAKIVNLSEAVLERYQKTVAEKDGFFVLNLLEPGPGDKQQTIELLEFIPRDRGEACPCGSGRAFGECCYMYGVGRLFAYNTDGAGFSLAEAYIETWSPLFLDFDEFHRILNNDQRFWCAEDSDQVCCWNYRGEQIVKIQGRNALFGAVWLQPDFLKIETISKQHYWSLRAAIEEAVGGQMPSGQLMVQNLVREESVTRPGKPEDPPAYLQYEKLRPVVIRVSTTAATEEPLQNEVMQGARELDIVDPEGVFVFDDEGEVSVLMDYLIYEVRRHGKPLITHYFRKHAPQDMDEKLVYAALENSFVSLFQLVKVGGDGIIIRDVLQPERKEMILVDKGLIASAPEGIAVYMRVIPFSDFVIGGGWGYVITPEQDLDSVVREYRKVMLQTRPRLRNAAAIRYFRRVGTSLHETNMPSCG